MQLSFTFHRAQIQFPLVAALSVLLSQPTSGHRPKLGKQRPALGPHQLRFGSEDGQDHLRGVTGSQDPLPGGDPWPPWWPVPGLCQGLALGLRAELLLSLLQQKPIPSLHPADSCLIAGFKMGLMFAGIFF